MGIFDGRSKRPTPLGSITASAKRMSRETLSGKTGTRGTAPWQEEAWTMYDSVGEQRFLATTLAGRMGQAKFYVGKIDPKNLKSEPEEIEDEAINAVLRSLGKTSVGLGQLVTRFGVNQFVAGDAWLLGAVPRSKEAPPNADAEGMITHGPAWLDDGGPSDDLDIEALSWHILSVAEVDLTQDGIVKVTDPDERDLHGEYNVDDVYLIRIWRPHPRRWSEADSSTRASLPVLRELVGMTQHVGAQIDSRLAGNGILLVPASASQAVREASGIAEDSEDDPLVDALIEAMIEPIRDRDKASAVVPLVLTVPDDSAQHFRHISFSEGLDAESRESRNEAIRRLAMGQDAPPELLLGTGSMNHWGAWLVQEDVVTTHLEPPLALFCDALTTRFLRPFLVESGMLTEEEAEQYVVWYDVDHLIVRPNRGSTARELYSLGVIGDAALRDASGFETHDAPEEADEQTLRERAMEVVLSMVAQAPSLAQSPGIPQLVQQIEQMFDADAPMPIDDTDTPPPADDPTQGPPADVPGIIASGTGPDGRSRTVRIIERADS